MNKAAAAYSFVAKSTQLPPRQLEASLLLQAAAKLQVAHDQIADAPSALDDALSYNRKLWTVLATSVTEPENPLDRGIRENVANLAVFMLSAVVNATLRPTKEGLKTMITINRELAAGLSGVELEP